jgi:rhamnose transport system substrate-binding protein
MYPFREAESIVRPVDFLACGLERPTIEIAKARKSENAKGIGTKTIDQKARTPAWQSWMWWGGRTSMTEWLRSSIGGSMGRLRWPLLLMLALLVGACERRASAPGGGAAPPAGGTGEKLRIAMMPKLVGIDYFNACRQGAEEAAKELGDVDLQYDGPTEARVDKQVEMIDTWVTQRVNAIAVAANDPVAIAPALKKARDAGITVITYDADADAATSGRQFFVNQCSADSIAEALTDEMAAQAGPDAKTAIVTSSMTAPNQNDWMRRMLTYRRKKYPQMRHLTTQPSEESQQLAFQRTQDILKARPEVVGIWALSSVAFPGAADAVRKAGKNGKVAVIGLSTPQSMAQFVKNGTVKTVILWNAVDLGYLAIHVARAVARGELKSDANTIKAGRLGEKSIEGDQVILGKPMRFTKENIDQYKF